MSNHSDIDADVEHEVDAGNGEWTDYALMLQFGPVSALEVQQEGDGKWIEQIRAR